MRGRLSLLLLILAGSVAIWAQGPAKPTNVHVEAPLVVVATGDCGIPGRPICDGTNTGIAGKGVAEGVLTAMAAGVTSSDGQLIYRRVINGNLCVIHNNVIIRESKINGSIIVGRRNSCSGSGDVTVTGLRVEDTTIDPSGGLVGIGDVNAVNSIYQRNDICCAQNFFTVWVGTNTQILSNYGHAEESDTGAPHFDGIEAYCWAGGLTIRYNTILQTQSAGATAPLNITPLGTNCGTSGLIVESNVLRSANSAYVILCDGNQGGNIANAVFNTNRLWRTTSGGYFSTSGCSTAQMSGAGNVDHISGATVAVP